MTAALWNTKTFQAWCDCLEQRYDLIENACFEATNKLRRGDKTAFAAFAKRVNWWERRFQKQTCHLVGIKRGEYQKWEREYKKLSYEIQKMAEASLPF